MEIWERGSGYTLSSGTSSCAAVAVSFLLNYCDDQVLVHMPGGKLSICIGSEFDITMRGPVTRIGLIDVDVECLRVEQ